MTSFAILRKCTVGVSCSRRYESLCWTSGWRTSMSFSVATAVTFAGTGNHLRPGDSGTAATGRLTVTGNVTLNAGTTATFRLNGAAAATGHDQLAVTGTVDLGGAVLATALRLVAGHIRPTHREAAERALARARRAQTAH